MISFLNKKKKNVKQTFEEYIGKDITLPTDAPIDKEENASMELWQTRYIKEDEMPKFSKEVNEQIKKLLAKIDATIKNEKFRNVIKARLVYMIRCGKINIGDNFFEADYKTKDLNYSFKMTISSNEVAFVVNRNNELRTGRYRSHKNNVVIDYSKREQTTYDLDDMLGQNVDNQTITRIYDEKGYETFNRTITVKDNYKENKITHETTINSPDIMENYTETEYKWRTEEGHVLTRTIKKYVYPDGTKAFIDLKNTDYCALRVEMLDNNTKDLPFGGYYLGYDKEIFLAYQQKKATIEDIAENVRSKEYHLPHTEWI